MRMERTWSATTSLRSARARTGHASLLSEGLGFDDPALAAGQAGPPRQDAVFEAAKTVGLEIVIDPFVEPERWLS